MCECVDHLFREGLAVWLNFRECLRFHFQVHKKCVSESVDILTICSGNGCCNIVATTATTSAPTIECQQHQEL